MRVFVTGASGFLGSHVADLLVAAGHDVRALVRATSATEHLERLGVELAVGAVDDPASLLTAVEGVDAVIHAAGLVKARSEADFDRVNFEGTANLLEAVVERAPALRRFVLVSSIAAGGPQGGDGPVSRYGRSKRRGEDRALELADRIPVSVIRPPVVYGPRDRETLSVFQAVSRGITPFVGHGRDDFSAIYVEDCAAAILAILQNDQGSGHIYHVDDGATHTPRELGAAIAEALGRRHVVPLRIPRAVAYVAATCGSAVARALGKVPMLTPDKVHELTIPGWVCGHAELTAATGWTPTVDLATGVRRAADWYRTQGWL